MSLRWQAVRFWPLLVVLLALKLVGADLNITLEDTASQIIYSPPACGLTLSSAGTETQGQICDSAWRIIASQDGSGGTLTTTSGPTNGSAGLVPQLFLPVRARALHVRTTSSSTAIVNVSVSTANPVLTVRSEFNSSLEFISIIGLPEDLVTTLSMTFVQSNRTTTLEIDEILVTISDNNTTPFVAPSLPSTTIIPTVTPSIIIPSPTQAPSTHHRQTSGDIAAEVLGALLGTALIATVILLLIRFRRKRRPPIPPEKDNPVNPPPA